MDVVKKQRTHSKRENHFRRSTFFPSLALTSQRTEPVIRAMTNRHGFNDLIHGLVLRTKQALIYFNRALQFPSATLCCVLGTQLFLLP